ncbi:probable cysteine--tRNA ligase, mitochondrial isoform X1 [Argonauta hians]
MVWFQFHRRCSHRLCSTHLKWLSSPQRLYRQNAERNLKKLSSSCLSTSTKHVSENTNNTNLCCLQQTRIISRHYSTWHQPEGFDTGIKVYNSLTKQKEKLILLHKNIATWYMCGPTVYDSSHLGHGSTYVQFDIIRRILTNTFGVHVVQVMSVTDVDDKIINKAQKLGCDISEVSKRFEYEFFEDMASLNVLPPSYPLRVTDNIDTIINFIDILLQKGFAYTTPDGSVYFSVAAYPDYGQLRQKQEIFEESSHQGKSSPLDFALWKSATQGSSWEAPWGKGRPGWHIECSAMASKIFGSNFDIHSGGEDLKFPHHENELAQSQTYHSCKQWCNYWLHTGHLHIKNQEKMSKSLQNVVLISDLLKNHTADQFRLFCMQTHYRNRISYQEDSLEKASNLLTQIESFLQNSSAYVQGQITTADISDTEILSKLDQLQASVRLSLADDFDFPSTVRHILDFVQFMNYKLAPTQDRSRCGRSTVGVAAAAMYVSNILQDFGFNASQQTTQGSSGLQLSQVISSAVRYRNQVRQFLLTPQESGFFGQDFENLSKKDKKKAKLKVFQPLLASSDAIRKEFSSMNIQIIDYENDSSWKFVNRKTKEE